jgi:hypothetical protein
LVNVHPAALSGAGRVERQPRYRSGQLGERYMLPNSRFCPAGGKVKELRQVPRLRSAPGGKSEARAVPTIEGLVGLEMLIKRSG